VKTKTKDEQPSFSQLVDEFEKKSKRTKKIINYSALITLILFSFILFLLLEPFNISVFSRIQEKGQSEEEVKGTTELEIEQIEEPEEEEPEEENKEKIEEPEKPTTQPSTHTQSPPPVPSPPTPVPQIEEKTTIEEPAEIPEEEEETVEPEYIDPQCTDSMLWLYDSQFNTSVELCEEYKKVTLPAVEECESNISEYLDDCKRLYGCYPTRMGIYCPGGQDYVACAYDKVSQCKAQYKQDLIDGSLACIVREDTFKKLEYCHNLGYIE